MKNKVAATRSAKPANPCFDTTWSAAWPWAAHIRNPVLLKTPSRARAIQPCSGLHSVSISCGALPMQRGCRTSHRSAVDPVTPYARSDLVRAPESCARRSSGDSNVHSGPLAVTRTEAHVFQRTHEGGSGILPARHIPGSGIPRKTGSMRDWQGDSQDTSWMAVF